MTDERTSASEVVLDDWKPQPFKERKSQNLNFGDYFMRGIMHLVVGTSGGWVAGWSLDKLLQNKGSQHTTFAYWGAFIGALVGSFSSWERREKFDLEINRVYEEYKDLPGLRRTNDEVQADNAILKRIVEHQREKLEGPKPQIAAHGSQRDGVVDDAHDLTKQLS